MKRALLIVGVMGLVVIVGLGVFLATFDADRCRPLVVKQLESALGRPVRLERISLGWTGGLALQLKGLAVFGDPESPEPTGQAERVSATVRLLPLLRRELQLSSLDITDGQLRLRNLSATPPLDIVVSALDVALRNVSWTRPVDFRLSAAVFGGAQNVQAQGRFRLPHQDQPGLVEEVRVQVEQMTLDQLGTDPGPNQPRLRGVLNGSFTGRAQGLAWPQISRSLSGEGHLTLTDARIENLNILREVFQRLSMLPGLLEALQTRLPSSYQARLEARDTILRPIKLQVTAADGALTFADLHVETDDLLLKGAGRVELDGGALIVQASVWIDPDLSAAVVRSVNELQSLSDAQGRLELPVVVQGTLPRVAVLPDLGQIGSRLVVHKAQELIGGLLQRALEKHLAPESETPPGP